MAFVVTFWSRWYIVEPQRHSMCTQQSGVSYSLSRREALFVADMQHAGRVYRRDRQPSLLPKLFVQCSAVCRWRSSIVRQQLQHQAGELAMKRTLQLTITIQADIRNLSDY